MNLFSNRVIEEDLREFLSADGYYGRSARFHRVELTAIERPGWLQVFTFEVRAKQQQDDNWYELFGACRDDERYHQFDVCLTTNRSVRDNRLTEWTTGMTSVRHSETESSPRALLAVIAFIATVVALIAIANPV